ncbi:MAG: response regulator, partial [Myxococcales bacterium]|nr:response regulator [Myxococcales bacterium]
MSASSGEGTTKVFLVDDDEVDRMAVKRLLDGVEGLRLYEFGSCKQAFAALADGSCGCLLLDYRM